MSSPSSSSPPAARPSIWDPLKSLSLTRELQRFSRGIKSSLNWGMGSFIVSSFTKYQLCLRDQQMEAARMRVVIEDFKRKKGKASASADPQPQGDAGSVTTS